MTTFRISDRTGPDSIKVGGWLFRHRTSIPIPIAVALVVLPAPTPLTGTPIAAGVVLTVLGESLRLWAVHHIGVISRTRSERLGPLVDHGPFGLCRNPLYVGNIAIWVGFTLTAGFTWLALLVLVLLVAEYHLIVRWEEALLDSRHGPAYRDYAGRVPRWIPFGGKRRLDGPERRDTLQPHQPVPPLQPVRTVLFSERGTLVAIAAGYLLLWLKTLQS